MTAGPKVSNAKLHEYLTNSDKPNFDVTAKVGYRRLKTDACRIKKRLLVAKI